MAVSCCSQGLRRLFGSTPRGGRRSQKKHKHVLPQATYKGKGRRFVNALETDAKRLNDLYTLGQTTGFGAFGSVQRATSLMTGKACVVKTMLKCNVEEESLTFIANEIEILSFVDHPNIVRFYDAFENQAGVHCVMQSCTGGELAERLRAEVSLSEQDAKTVMFQISRAIHYLHSYCHVAHRDLKPQNILLEKGGQPLAKSQVKLIDFGLAKEFEPGTFSFDDICGTRGYMAPEILQSAYNEKCDVYAMGILLYEMIQGTLPFAPFATSEIHDCFPAEFYISEMDFEATKWEHISGCAKLVIRKMCEAEPCRRMSAEQALNYRWFADVNHHNVQEAAMETRSRLPFMTRNVESFVGAPNSPANVLREEALQRVAYDLEDEDVSTERYLFEALDSDGSGRLTKAVCEQFLGFLGAPTDKIDMIFERMDMDSTGTLGYTEFLSTAIQGKECSTTSLKAAFCAFDYDKNGTISVNDLSMSLSGKSLSHEDLQELVRQADCDHDGELDFREFVAMLPIVASPTGGHDVAALTERVC